jgi:hypothetical protein
MSRGFVGGFMVGWQLATCDTHHEMNKAPAIAGLDYTWLQFPFWMATKDMQRRLPSCKTKA